MKKQVDSPIVILGSRLLSPFIMLFGFYVIAHGHYSPGGGFQGGALLAASVLLMRLAAGQDSAPLQMREAVMTPLAVIGVLIFFGTGMTALLMGGHFLDYARLPNPGMEAAQIRYYGTFIIEIGIGMAVMAILIMIYDNMVNGEDYD